MAYVRYKTAPTSLYKWIDGVLEKQKFYTQEEVDQAWEDGWFGPRTLHDEPPKKVPGVERVDPEVGPDDLLSAANWTVPELKKLLKKDPRYRGFKTNYARSKRDIRFALIEFEAERGLAG